MKKINILFLLYLFSILASCGTIKEGFKNPKKNNSDEFLVEKKSPLVMPPDYNELPIPNKETNQTENEENFIKDLVAIEENISDSSNVKNSQTKGVEESFLEKIKNN